MPERSAGEAFERLLAIMARLRGPGGCPWDHEQTHESLKPALIEEAYELIEAIESGSAGELRDELGDLLLQFAFHAQIAAERGDFDAVDCIDAICEKLIRRHPHVFGDAEVRDADEVLERWHEIKMSEDAHRDRTSALDGVPRAMPALMRAQELGKKASRVGFDWSDAAEVVRKIREETDELAEHLDAGGEAAAEEVGDLLFSVVNLARKLGVDAEDALSGCIDKFVRRFRYVEEKLAGEGLTPADVSLQRMDELWEEAKRLGA